MIKHNKKRNSFLVYEQLVTLATRLTVEGCKNEAGAVLNLIKEHFNKETEISKELKLFNSVLGLKEKNKKTAGSIVEEALREASQINDDKLEQEKTKLIEDINFKLSKDLHKIPVKNYKTAASFQILINEARTKKTQTTPVERVKIKNFLVETMSKPEEKILEEKIDGMTFAILCKKFNKRYDALMNEDQKEILSTWSKFLIDTNEEKANSILENKINKIKDYLRTEIGSSKHKDSEYQPMLKEAYSNIVNKKPELTENGIYEIMKYFDLVEDLKSYNVAQEN